MSDDTAITNLDGNPESETGHTWATSLFARQSAGDAPSDEPVAAGQDAHSPGDRGTDASALGTGGRPDPIDLSDLAALGGPAPTDDTPSDSASRPVDQGKVWAVVLAVIVLVFTGFSGSIMLFTSRDDPAPSPKADVPALAEGAPTVEPAPPEVGDDVIPYMASGDPAQTGCYDGSTSPGALQETDTESAWVCVRGFGSAGGGTNGQILPITLGNEMTGPRWYLVCKVEFIPGFVAKVEGGRDEWLQHRVPTRVRFAFNDSTDPQRPNDPYRTPTVWDIDTGGAPGPATYTAPKCVLASSITMVILETQRPKAEEAPTEETPTTSPPLFPGPTTTTEPTEDPSKPTAVDATFAMSLLRFEGRQP
ncbi:hypothetical protein [Mycolicibacterium peregrinum]|uniref:hypothetical protein n=1 Tax=Mycolicibacterium peregrinum TaxID=43304 RepID=UPI003AAF758D